eukprot:CAMPEP_0181327786 /NCGR_PEP_ID=MMETSP1101-20121128/22306_1 /TAXON_ID=46948 /ORGANISM="Rhodomonas abbreviata, Strain Caron Lab Isolate" /LENGTH=587 /DNA_ID=CAMNT_0023436507 /DNA_START=132 /DNA_END=1895 /DNA_ORIENTATION=-
MANVYMQQPHPSMVQPMVPYPQQFQGQAQPQPGYGQVPYPNAQSYDGTPQGSKSARRDVQVVSDPWTRKSELHGKILTLDEPFALRQIFRLLDTSGDRAIDSKELAEGMTALGYPEFEKSPVALDALVRAIDADLTGSIEEAEFLNFFTTPGWKSKFEALRKKTTPSMVGVRIFRWPYGPSTSAEHGMDYIVVPKTQLPDMLRSMVAEGAQYNYWVEVNGYDRAVYEQIAATLPGVQNHDDLTKLLVFGAATYTPADNQTNTGARWTLHDVDLSLDPIPERAKTDGCWKSVWHALFTGSDHSTPDELSPYYLKKRKLLTNYSVKDIKIRLEQVGIMQAHDKILITFRHVPASAPGIQPTNKWAQVIRFNSGARTGTDHETLDTDTLFDDLRERVDQEFRKPYCQQLSAQKFMQMMSEKLLDSNNTVRDKIRDWMLLIEVSVRGAMRTSIPGIHLEAMTDLLKMFKRHLQSLKGILPESSDLTDIHSELETLMKSTDKMMEEKVVVTSDRLEKRKDENMNRTLYALTLVTTIAMPASILTGLFGMNFDDMRELESEVIGYRLFWILLLPTIFLTTMLLLRLGVFHAVM